MKMMQKILLVAFDLCTACGACELACSFEKTEEFSKANSGIRLFTWEKTAEDIPILCYHCEDGPCIAACGVPGAIKRDPETNAVLIDETRCIGCKVCMAACPYGAISIDRLGKVIKCDYCGGEPKCAEVCPTNAIIWARGDKASIILKIPFVEKLRTASKTVSAALRS